jgi:hypothetical protein
MGGVIPSSSSSSSFNIVAINIGRGAKLKNLITYDFGFLVNAHNFKPPTPTLKEGRIIGIDGGVDFSCKQHSITINVISIGSKHGSLISMSSSMSCHYYQSGVQFINLNHYGTLKVK